MKRKLYTILIWVIAWICPLLAIYAAVVSGALHKPWQWWCFALDLVMGVESVRFIRAITITGLTWKEFLTGTRCEEVVHETNKQQRGTEDHK